MEERSCIAWTMIATIVMAISATSAAAQSPSMLLSCTGHDVTYQQTGTTTTTRVSRLPDPITGGPRVVTEERPEWGNVRVPARMTVAIDGEVIRVRPSKASSPSFYEKQSPDGWYSLTDVAITENEIRAQATYGALGKPKLKIDRRSGDVRFGVFVGACEKVADDASARKF